jgi:hypothetical protein
VVSNTTSHPRTLESSDYQLLFRLWPFGLSYHALYMNGKISEEPAASILKDPCSAKELKSTNMSIWCHNTKDHTMHWKLELLYCHHVSPSYEQHILWRQDDICNVILYTTEGEQVLVTLCYTVVKCIRRWRTPISVAIVTKWINYNISIKHKTFILLDTATRCYAWWRHYNLSI